MKEIRYFRSFDENDFNNEIDCARHETELLKDCAKLIQTICKSQDDTCNGCPIRTQCGEYCWCPETWELD